MTTRTIHHRNASRAQIAGILAAVSLSMLLLDARAVPVGPANGLQFAQVNFTFPGAAQPYSAYGLIQVNIPQMTNTTGLSLGFLNVYKPATTNWIVRNLPVDAASGLPGISTMFDLENTVGTPVATLNVQADLSPVPLTSFTGAGPVTGFTLTAPVDYNAQGYGDASRTTPPDPTNRPNPGLVVFQPPNNANTFLCWQIGHPSVEQEENQCAPASVANSLDWMRSAYPGRVPLTPALQNIPGIRGVPANSLVGQMDLDMGRPLNLGIPGSPIVRGKVRFVDTPANGLRHKLDLTHFPAADQNVAGDYTIGETTSTDVSGFGGTFADWLLREVCHGEDVEIGWIWDGGGGHFVNLIGAGMIGGVPWIAFTHDAKQTYDAVNNTTKIDGGVSWFDGGIGFTTIVGNRILPLWVGGHLTRATLGFGMAESPRVPEAKWCQLPGYRIFLNTTNRYGADRPSDFNWNEPDYRCVVADDFRSDGRPIRVVRWWGSHLNYHNEGDIDGYLISFFSDLRPTNSYSRPDALLGSYLVPRNVVRLFNTLKYGWDTNDNGTPVDIYQYEATLQDACLDHSVTNIARPDGFYEVSNTVYWVAISAERGCIFTNQNGVWTNYPSNRPALTNYFWGWHTSPCTNEDASVTGLMNMIGTNWNYGQWVSNDWYHMELDQAFELLTDVPPPPIKIPNTKVFQHPDRTCEGLDVLATDFTDSKIVADDFLCTTNGYIWDIHVWGSWLNDAFDPNAAFELRFWSNDPGPPSHPAQLLWTRVFFKPDYTVGVIKSNLCESFYDPSIDQGIGVDTKIFQYDFPVPARPGEPPFYQTNNNIYWLSVTALNTTNKFGWKTCVTNDHYMDDAAFGRIALPPQNGWTPLRYPPCHPFYPQTLDMAFALTTTKICGPARLSAAISGGNAVLSWSTVGYVLQQASSITGPYTDVLGGDVSPVTVQIQGGIRFFRLCCR